MTPALRAVFIGPVTYVCTVCMCICYRDVTLFCGSFLLSCCTFMCTCRVQFLICRQDDPSLGGNSVKMFHLLADPCVCVCLCACVLACVRVCVVCNYIFAVKMTYL